MYCNAKKINILCLKYRKLRTFPGKFLNFGKSASVKDLTNIMSACLTAIFTISSRCKFMYVRCTDLSCKFMSGCCKLAIKSTTYESINCHATQLT